MVTCYCDGGCDNTVKKDAYGSYVIIQQDGSFVKNSRFELESTTSNEAEYDTLICLLERLLTDKESRAIIYSDSKLMVNQVNGGWRVEAENLKHRRARVISLLKHFEEVKLYWVSRKIIVNFLGH